MSFPRAGKSQTRVSRPAVLARFSLPMNPPLERDRSPVAAAPTACSCRNLPQVADFIRARCAPGRRALRTPAGSGAQGAIKVRGVLSPSGGEGAQIALFDPKGETATLLETIGVRARQIPANADLSAYDILVVGKA